MAELLQRREGAVGWIILSNPAKHNAVTYEMIVALPEAMAALERDPQVKLIAMRGEGERAFAAGADVTEFAATRGSSAATQTYNQAMAAAYEAVASARKPTIAYVRGACLGAGLSLALYCDLRVCSADAELAQPIARVALALSAPSVKRLVDLVGPARATDLLFTGRRLDAPEALALGLVDRLWPRDRMDEEFAKFAAGIVEGAPLSIAASKLSIRAALGDGVDMRDVRAAIDACHASEDYVEGRQAFAAKRKPVFRGR